MNEAIYARSWLILSFVVIVLDQVTKWLAESMLQFHQPVAVFPMFNLTLVHNSGAAFSFLSDAGGWQRWFFIILAVIVSTMVFQWLWRLRSTERLHAAALALILGGALGNLIDRVINGYVIDFIDMYYETYHWPVFNIADSAITIGVILLIIDLMFIPKKTASQD
ncbi:MAG: lipoprotein signal peptidase [Gammaproteobacteria bacterium]|nr:MAG: lipoprotein signal peptidase [Gammaproteobacteria bacterium]